MDAKAEHPDQINLSPYNYVANNPINKTDPDGNCPPCKVPPLKDNTATRILTDPKLADDLKDIKERSFKSIFW